MKRIYQNGELKEINLNESSIEQIRWFGENGINLEMTIDWCGQENLQGEVDFTNVETKLIFEVVSNIDFNFRHTRQDTFGSVEITDFIYKTMPESNYNIEFRFDFQPNGHIKLSCNNFLFIIESKSENSLRL